MHGFGNIGRAEIDYHGPRLRCLVNAEPGVGRCLLDARGDP